MVTKKFLIYCALSSTIVGAATTYFVISRNLASIARNANYSFDRDAQYEPGNTANNSANNSTFNSTYSSANSSFNNSSGIENNTLAAAAAANSSPSVAANTENNPSANYASSEQGAQMNTTNAGNASEDKNTAEDNYKISSQKGYALIKPILWAKPIRESQIFAPLKAQILNLMEKDERQGKLATASVYLYSFSDGEWTCINPNESFNPGSLIKVPLLITYLKEAEKDPKLLDKKILCENFGYIPTQTYETNTINPGHTYTVRELLHYMIAYSDNNATNLLNKNMDVNSFRKTFTDLKIPEPDLHDYDYIINAKRYSRFFMVLYNATYLSRASSEYALKLLTECDFKDGLVKGIPGNVPIAHKFGEWGNKKIHLAELHESGIIYLNDRHYLVTVMTRGTNTKDLGEEVSKISQLAYDALSAKPNM
jgi:beta-lactamase class A